MWHKNITLFRTQRNLSVTASQLAGALAKQSFLPCGEFEHAARGFSPVRDGLLAYQVGQQIAFKFSVEKRLLPGSVVKEALKIKAKELEEQQGFPPGRKAMKELKERVTEELLTKSHCVKSDIAVWLDPVNGWLAIDSSSQERVNDVIKALIKCDDGIPLQPLRVKVPPQDAMTKWLLLDEVPAGFTVDKDIELQGNNVGTVRYVKETLEPDDAKKLIENGKHCTKLALTWRDKVSFVLTNTLAIKRIKALDILAESKEVAYSSEERQDADFALMTGELAQLFADLMAVLQEDTAQYAW